MAGLAQTTIQKINHWYERILPKWPAEVTPRNVLIFCVVALLCIGSVMVASASMPYAEYMHENPFHYVIRHGISIVAAGVVAYLTYRISLNTWFKKYVSIVVINHGSVTCGFGCRFGSQWFYTLD